MTEINPSLQLSQCEGKHRYDSYSAAQIGIRKRLKGKIQAFHCSVCDGWHLGGQETRRKVILAKKAIMEKRKNGTDEA